MLKRYQRITRWAYQASDSIVISAVWLSAYWFRFNVPVIQVTKGFPPFAEYLAITPLVLFLWLIVFNLAGVYQPSRILRRTDEVLLVFKGHIFASLLFVSLTYLFGEYRFSRAVMAFFTATGGGFLLASRIVIRNSLREYHRRRGGSRTSLIVGSGPNMEGVLWRMERFPELGLKILGYIAPNPVSDRHSIQSKYLGNYSQFTAMHDQFRPLEIVFAFSRNEHQIQDDLITSVQDEMCTLRLVPDVHEYVTLGCVVEDLNGVPTININDTPLEGIGLFLKRITDIIVSLLLIIVLFPMFLLIALGIKLSSSGPVLYAQERMGLDGKSFHMLKFRSMKIDAEIQDGAQWATADDPRKTKFGSFLRKTSLDEFPQLWNVLIGNMSLVGPRPERPIFVHKFRKDIPHYMLRHKAKAGMTGWAQIHGWRGNTSLEKRIECDLYYIRNWSYLLDVKILAMTAWKGFIHKNAY